MTNVPRRPTRFSIVTASAAVVLTLIVIASAAAPLLAPADPLGQDLRNTFGGPSRANWLGTDWLGRDVFSRLLFAGRASLTAAAQATAVAGLIGGAIGLVAGFVGGKVDTALTWVIDALLALPGLVLALAVVAVLGPGLTNAMLAVGVVLAPIVARLTRSITRSIRNLGYVDAAWIAGAPTHRTIRTHVIPNLAGPLVIQLGLVFGLALLVEAGISVLGLGVQAPDASWGGMLAQASPFLRESSWLVVPPGLAIVVTVLCVNLAVDGIPNRRQTLTRLPASRSAAPAIVSDGDRTDHDRPTVEVASLSVSLGGSAGPRPVVDDVSFDVHPGEILGIVGESGSGKSVTVRALLGLHPDGAVSGRVAVGGTDIVTASETQRNEVRAHAIGYVPQHPITSLHPSRTVGAQMLDVIRHRTGVDRNAARQRSIDLLDQVGLDDPERVLTRYPHELSGGMAQRVIIAMAISGRPRLLVADEPTSALDVTHQARILDLLVAQRQRTGAAIVIVSHDLGVVSRICDSVVVMYAGQIVEQGETDSVLADPQHPYTRALTAAVPRLGVGADALPDLPGVVPAPGERSNICRFAPRCAHHRPPCDAGPAPVIAGVRCHRAGTLDTADLDRRFLEGAAP